jgi:hypothetical protein
VKRYVVTGAAGFIGSHSFGQRRRQDMHHGAGTYNVGGGSEASMLETIAMGTACGLSGNGSPVGLPPVSRRLDGGAPGAEAPALPVPERR